MRRPQRVRRSGGYSSIFRGFYTGSSATDTVSQDVVEVHWTDTTRTRFGAGWQLAEMSRLIFTTYQSQSVALWVKGDGSSTLFRYNGSAWVGPAGETAKLVARNDSDSSAYAIEFPNGTAAGFTSTGFQRYSRTWSATRRTTAIATRASSTSPTRRASATSLPRMGTGGFPRSAGANPGGTYSKLLTLVYNGSGQLSRMRQWKDGTTYDSTSFAYQASAPGAFLDSVVDPRGQLTTFSYDARFFTPTGATTPPLHGTRLSMSFRDQWRRAAPRLGYGRASSQPLEWLRYTGQYVGT